MSYLNFNGKIVTNNQPVFMATNRSFRYGDGLFETMKMIKGSIQLSRFHFERLFSSLTILKYEIPSLFSAAKIEKEIMDLCRRNTCEKSGRVRLSVFRGNGGINDVDKRLQYIIESWPLPESLNQLNENGLVIDTFPDAQKSIDKFSNIKSANYLPYSMASIYAKENKLNDCLVLNANGNIADATIANMFIMKEGLIKTPALQEGCVNGVMRRHLLEKFAEADYKVLETVVAIDDMLTADEIFLSNAIYGIRWVKQCRDAAYDNSKTVEIYNRFIRTIHT